MLKKENNIQIFMNGNVISRDDFNKKMIEIFKVLNIEVHINGEYLPNRPVILKFDELLCEISTSKSNK